MSSILRPSPRTITKLTGGAAGIAAGAYAFVDTQRLIWRNAAEDCRTFGTLQPLPRDPEEELFFGSKTRALAVRTWNLAVDSTVGALATELAKRGL